MVVPSFSCTFYLRYLLLLVTSTVGTFYWYYLLLVILSTGGTFCSCYLLLVVSSTASIPSQASSFTTFLCASSQTQAHIISYRIAMYRIFCLNVSSFRSPGVTSVVPGFAWLTHSIHDDGAIRCLNIILTALTFSTHCAYRSPGLVWLAWLNAPPYPVLQT